MKPLIHCEGNTLSEYALVGALITLVCIAGCLTAGNNLADLIGGLKGDMQAHAQAAVTTRAATAPLANSLSSATSPISGRIQQLTTQDQALLGQSLAEKLQTTGANGTTELMAKQLSSVAQQLLADGKITQAQSDSILQLANQGYQMAKIEEVLENGVRLSGGDMQKFAQMTFTIDGKTLQAQEWAQQVGFGPSKPVDFANADILTDRPEGAGEAIARFRDLYQQTMSSISSSDPAIAATVQSAATQIATVGESVEDNVWAAVNMSSQYGFASIDDFNNRVASSSTKVNSSKICTSGDFQTDGTLCTP